VKRAPREQDPNGFVVWDRGPSGGVHPAFPVIDRQGRVWYVVVDEACQVPPAAGGLVPETVEGRVVDGHTGEIVDGTASGTLVDQGYASADW